MLKIYELLKRLLFDIFSKSKKIIVSLQGNLDKKIKSKPEISKEPQIKEKKVEKPQTDPKQGDLPIKNDSNWINGDYIKKDTAPEQGLAAARMVAHITYMSEKSLSNKFGRNKKSLNPLSKIFEGNFEVENYLQYQGSSFVSRFDANSYLHLTRSMDRFDLSEKFNGNLEKVFKSNTCKWLIISFNSDWLFPTSESKRLVNALNANACNVSFVEIESDRGHDSFLLQIPRLYNILRGFLIGAKFK